MEAKFDVGDIVYVQGQVLSVEEQIDDVRYSVATSIAKYFCTQEDDVIRRSADSKDMLNKTFEEGREAYYDAMAKIAVMTPEQLEDCFGSRIKSMEDLFTSDDYDYASIVDTYNEWWNTLYTKVNDIVEYEPGNGEVLTCVVMNVRLFSVNGDGEAEMEDVDPDTLDPTSLSNLAYVLFDPINQLIYTEMSTDKFTNTGKQYDIRSHIDEISEEFSQLDGVDLGFVETDEYEVISSDDPDFEDDEYEEDDIDEVEEPAEDDDSGSDDEGGDDSGDEGSEDDNGGEEG